jgi:serine/threonine-protein kinase
MEDARTVGRPARDRQAAKAAPGAEGGPAAAPPASGAATTGAEPDDPFIGRTVGGFRVARKLGEGGMGAVYLLQHETLDRRQVLKVLHSWAASEPAMVQRFFQEARLVAALRHPNIVEVFDCARLPNGEAYFTMEYLEGETLRARLDREGRLSLADTVAILAPICDGLQAAHDKGVIHRDLKPENLFLAIRSPGAPPIPVLLDFGIAKQEGAASQTATGTVIGSPRYMSPEQGLGHSTEIEARSDVYSLGIVAYELLTGDAPFTAPGSGELCLLHALQPWVPIDRMRPELGPAVEQVVGRALAKRREERWASAAELGRALRGLLVSGTAIAAPTPWTPPPRRRSRLLLWIGVTLLAGIIIAVSAARESAPDAPQSPDFHDLLHALEHPPHDPPHDHNGPPGLGPGPDHGPDHGHGHGHP